MKQKQFWKDLSAVTVATIMIGVATCCYVRAEVGSDAVAVFLDGLTRFAGISLGTASRLLNIVLLVIAFLTARRQISWTTVFSSLCSGWFIDLAQWLLQPVFQLSDGLWLRWGLFAAGLVLIAGSSALMMRTCTGMSVLDAIAARIAEKLGRSFRLVRMSIDSVLMLSGWLMGGIVGVGSVIAVLATGPLIQWFYQFGKKS